MSTIQTNIKCLLQQCGANLKPFLPQLQTTFMKAFNDINRGVRIKAAEALGKLVTIHNRIDSLFAELIALTKTSEDIGMRLLHRTFLFMSTLVFEI